MRGVRIPILPVAALVGVALIGDGVNGSLGAGVALLGSVTAGFLASLTLVGPSKAARPKRRTFRHRWFLLVDQHHRRQAARARERAARKIAELAYLKRRRSAR